MVYTAGDRWGAHSGLRDVRHQPIEPDPDNADEGNGIIPARARGDRTSLASSDLGMHLHAEPEGS